MKTVLLNSKEVRGKNGYVNTEDLFLALEGMPPDKLKTVVDTVARAIKRK
jgi:hypothetical protein